MRLGKQNERYLLVVQLLLFIAGLFLIIIISIIPGVIGGYSTLIQSLGISFIVTATITFFSWFFGTDLATRVKEICEFKYTLEKLGLQNIYTTIPDLDNEIIRKARSMDIMVNTGKKLFDAKSQTIIEAMDKGCKVRIIISDPDSIMWTDNLLRKSLCPKLLSTDITQELNESIIPFLNELKRKKPSSLEIRKYKGVPTCNLLIINDNFVRHTPYLPFAGSTNVPTYEVEGEDSQLLKRYKDAFSMGWEQSEEITHSQTAQ